MQLSIQMMREGFKDLIKRQAGKNADVVLWSGDPFSVYSLAEQVFIDGALAFDRNTGFGPVSDFDVGIVDPREDRVND